MTMQYSTTLRNAQLDQIETVISTAAGLSAGGAGGDGEDGG